MLYCEMTCYTLICRRTVPQVVQLESNPNFELLIIVEKYGISPIESVEVELRIPFAVSKGDSFLTIHSFQVKILFSLPHEAHADFFYSR